MPCTVHIIHERCFIFFFFNDTATTEIYTLSLHDALPILICNSGPISGLDDGTPNPNRCSRGACGGAHRCPVFSTSPRSEEHTSELQSQSNLVCRLLLEKKKKIQCGRK